MLQNKEYPVDEVDAKRAVHNVIGSAIDPIDWDRAICAIQKWALARSSRYVCICNVHSVVTSRRDPLFREAISKADMATPDGAPVAWLMRRIGVKGQQRINGPDLMWRYCRAASLAGDSIFLYGASEITLSKLIQRLTVEFPGLRIAGSYSPPFRTLSKDEQLDIVERINSSGAGTVWISLGCPKQELWMAAHRGVINAVMIGVGAAFDYHAGTIRRAPVWMQRRGLEWAYRLGQEPRRLWRRYLVTNTLFLGYASFQVIKHHSATAISTLTFSSFRKRSNP